MQGERGALIAKVSGTKAESCWFLNPDLRPGLRGDRTGSEREGEKVS
jgi:hypothetical protein